MGCYMHFITTMYLPLFHLSMLIVGPIISGLSNFDDRDVLEGYHEFMSYFCHWSIGYDDRNMYLLIYPCKMLMKPCAFIVCIFGSFSHES